MLFVPAGRVFAFIDLLFLPEHDHFSILRTVQFDFGASHHAISG